MCPLVLVGLVQTVRADTSVPQDWGLARQAAERHLRELAERTYAGTQAMVEVGPVDPRLRMTRCAKLEFSLPPGSRPAGNGSLGVRCESPEPWSLYLTYQIGLRGPALVLKWPVAARQALREQDVETRAIVYETTPDRYLRRGESFEGAVAARPLAAGQALTVDSIQRRQAVRAGQRVKLIVVGSGFQVSQEGVALNDAAAGDTVRVRAPNGRVLQGSATADGRVRMHP
ncbi:MAG: flagellar basal body P-ring formation chaperone FlgA [Thiobacillaceae bacterium]|nr:flagellar basal body P-ring formation chaperone FlgA [Thiobacillaceae bacterium]